MTDEELHVVQDVINVLAKDFVFDIYDIEDIGQEIYIICNELIGNYDDSKGEFFPFLLGATRSRLISFKREKYCHSKSKTSEQKLALLHTYDIVESDLVDHEIKNDIFENEQYIDKNIPAHLREDYIKLKEGLPVIQKSKNQILEYISKISKHLDGK